MHSGLPPSVERTTLAAGTGAELDALTGADFELRALLAITRSLPRVPGAVRIAATIRTLYLRKPRRRLIADVLGFKMKLDPSDWVEGGLLFWPQLWDYQGFRF